MIPNIGRIVPPAIRKNAVLLEQVRVSGKREEKRETDGRLCAPIRVGNLLGEGEGCEIAYAKEGEEDADEGRGCGGLGEFAGCGLQRLAGGLSCVLDCLRAALPLP